MLIGRDRHQRQFLNQSQVRVLLSLIEEFHGLTCKKCLLAAAVSLPLAFVVFFVSQHGPDENVVGQIIDLHDQTKFVAADVENNTIADETCFPIGRLHVMEIYPTPIACR